MLLLWIISLTAVVAVAAPFLARTGGRAAGWPIAAALLTLGVVLWAAAPSATTSVVLPWMPSLGIDLAFRLDGLGLLFALLVLLIGGLVMAYSTRYLPPGKDPAYYGLMALFALAMLGLVLADDVVVLFVLWETTTLCSFFLIARSGRAAREPAVRTLLVTAGGGLALLTAVVVMAVSTGTTRLSEILTDPVWGERPGQAALVATLVALAAFTKSAQFPFHAWLPDAMAAATPVSAYLHAAAMVKAGIYLLMRFSAAFGELPVWNILLITAGLTTGIMGALFALQRHDLKELLAYSTVSQLGLLTAVIGIGTPAALAAAAIHTVAHALFKSSLFMLVGVVDHQAGTRDIRRLPVLTRAMPWTVSGLGLAALSMAGLPPLLGFISKETIFGALIDAPGPGWTGPVVVAGGVVLAVLTFGYAGRIMVGAVAGPVGGAVPARTPREAAPPFLAPALVAAAAGLVLGPAVATLDNLVTAAASTASGQTYAVAFELWHGLSVELGLSALVIVAGTALVLARRQVETLLDRALFPVAGTAVVDATRSATIRLGARVGDLTRTDAPARHLAITVVSVVVVAAGGAVAIGALPAAVGSVDRATDWALVTMLLIGVVGAVTARSRLAAIAVVGIVGFSVTLWFFALGAADVALTQLLVEILTVVVMVMLLRRLPTRFRRTSRRRTIGAGVVAAAAGLATTAAVIAMTGRRDLSEAGTYFLREAEELTGGTNVVNTILVDFRALDTLGELTVLGVAGVSALAALQARGLLPVHDSGVRVRQDLPLSPAHENAVFGRSLTRMVAPALIVASIVFLFRGHNAPGGGFIAALIGGAGFALAYLTASADRSARIRAPYLALIGGGVIIGVGSGLLGYADDSFLRPLHGDLLGIHLTTALIFDVGVYLAVIGVVLAALNRLGRAGADPPGVVAEPPTVTSNREQT